jgi:heme oxygenase-like protein
MEAGSDALGPRNDRLSIGLATYYDKHSKEETLHDEWLLADLETMGVQRTDVLSRRPRAEVAELVGSQYYWILHFHPVSLLGYIAVMEGYPPNRKAIDIMALRTGYPQEAFRTLAKHSYLDPGHRDDLNRVLDTLPMDREQEEWITLNAIYTLGKWNEVIDSF